MDVTAELQELEKDRLGLLKLAARIVEGAGCECRPVASQEDAVVLGLMMRVRLLETRIERLKRHHNIKEQEQRK